MHLTEKDYLEKIEKIEKEKAELNERLRKLKIKERKRRLEKKYEENNEKRKKRTRHLITIGGLVKAAGIDEEDKETLFGFFLEYHKLEDYRKDSLKINGIIEFERQKREKEKLKEEKIEK